MEEQKIIEKLIQNFMSVCGGEPKLFFAPGRVNLIGEHTDYNGGHVFPCALTLGTYAAVRRRDDRLCRFGSLNIDGGRVIEFSLDDPALLLLGEPREGEMPAFGAGDWTNYPKGVIWAFRQKGLLLDTGFDMMIYGNIPSGSGLSSSASLEVLTGLILRELYGFDVPQTELAIFGQRAENAYVGMNCGIMDQFASAMGRKGCAVFLDTNTLEYKYAPLAMEGLAIVITNSGVKHQLASSEYNTRRSECEEAVARLKEMGAAIRTLGDLTPDEFEPYAEALPETIRRRARHAVTENARTIEAVAALNAGGMEKFGSLMNDSHISLRDDFAVSCPEVDFLVDQAWKLPGVLGSRITGGGFGGCTVSIVREEAVEEFQSTIAAAYEKAYNMKAEFYVVNAGEGAHVI